MLFPFASMNKILGDQFIWLSLGENARPKQCEQAYKNNDKFNQFKLAAQRADKINLGLAKTATRDREKATAKMASIKG